MKPFARLIIFFIKWSTVAYYLPGILYRKWKNRERQLSVGCIIDFTSGNDFTEVRQSTITVESLVIEIGSNCEEYKKTLNRASK